MSLSIIVSSHAAAPVFYGVERPKAVATEGTSFTIRPTYGPTAMTTTELPAPTPKPLDPPPAPEPEIFEVTAYTAGPESTGKRRGDPNYGLTADGSHVADGIVACPKSYPFGTKFYVVELDRTFTCRDRGGAIKAGHLDIYVESLQTADDFGRQWLHVIVKPVHVD